MTLLAIISFLILLVTTFKYWIEFAVEFVTHITIRRVFGLLLVIAGVWLIGAGSQTGNPDKFILFATLGLIIGGIGAVIIYHDFAKDKIYGNSNFSEVDTLTKAYQSKERQERKLDTWNLQDKEDKK